MSLIISQKWSVSCHISKQGRDSHQRIVPSKCECLHPKDNQEGE